MLKRKAYAAPVEAVGERQVRVICSTDAVDRLGEVVVQEGINLDAYHANPIVLWGHDPDQPIGRAAVSLSGGQLHALVDFPPPGVSAKADEVCGLVKAGIINTVSIGFDPVEMEPMEPDDRRKDAPLRYLKSELLELSFVTIPANRDAQVTQRQLRRRAAAAPVLRGLWQVGLLAETLQSVGWLAQDVAWEAEFEQDASQVPAMLAEAMQKLADALLAMTAEEVAELLAADLPPGITTESESDQAAVTAGTTPALRKFLAGYRRRADAPAPPATTHTAERRQRARSARVMALG